MERKYLCSAVFVYVRNSLNKCLQEQVEIYRNEDEES